MMAAVIKQELFNQPGVTAIQAGQAISTGPHWREFVGYMKVSNISGTLPSFTGKIQHSPDGVEWFDLVIFASKTTNSSEVASISVNVLPKVRGIISDVGGTGPSATVQIDLFHTALT